MADDPVAKAWVQIIPEMSGAQEKISKGLVPGSKESGEKAGKASGSGFVSTFKGAIGTLSGIVAAVGFGRIVSEAASATDATQKFKSTLDFAGLGTPEIEALSKATRKYADETVYSLSDIQSITAQLAANGVPNYDKLAEAAGNLNAVSGGNADTFKSVGMALTQTAGAGKLTTENWNQLSDAIPGASGRLQEAMKANGAYTGNFREAMEKGQITADEFNQAIMDLGFEDASVEAAKSTETFEGSFGNMSAVVVGGLSDIVSKLQGPVTGAVNALAPVVESAFGVAADAVQAVIDNFDRIAPVVMGAAGAFVAFKAAAGLGGLVQTLSAPIGAIRIFIAEFGAVSSLCGPLAAVKTSVSMLGSGITTLCGGPVGLAIAAIAAVVGAVVYAYNTNETARAAIDNVWNSLQQLAATVWPAIQGVITGVMDAVASVIGTVWPVIMNVIVTVMNVINGVITTVLAAINGDWDGVWNGIKGIASIVWEGIKGVISSGIEVAAGVIGSVLGTIKGIWDNAWNALKGFCADIWEGIKSGVSNGIQGVMNFIGELPGKITGFFADAGSWLIDSGKAMLDGLKKGIESGIKGACDAVKGGLKKIRDFFPFSPAKTGPFSGHGYTTYSGRALMGDFGQSIEKSVPTVVGMLDGALAEVNAVFAASPAPVANMPAASDLLGAGRDDSARSITQTININQPVRSPDELARYMRLQERYGLAAIY